MILGISIATYTFLHVLISVIGIGSGVVVMWGMLKGKRLDGITAIFLSSTALTSITGFGFPFEKLLPSHKLRFSRLLCWPWLFRRAIYFNWPAYGGPSTSWALFWPCTSTYSYLLCNCSKRCQR